MIDLTSELGEIKDKQHNKGSKIYPQNQVILDQWAFKFDMLSATLHKCAVLFQSWNYKERNLIFCFYGCVNSRESLKNLT